MKHNIIYFDNAATSNYKPLCVKISLFKSLVLSANPGRSGHKLSFQNAQAVWNTRETVAKYFNLENAEDVIFTKNCTEALNIAILGLLGDKNKNKCHVICSCFEHNSILRPLYHLQQEDKIELTVVKPENKNYITKIDIEKHIKPTTFLVCLTHISNVTGNKNDIEDVGKLCHEKNINFLVDCAQSAGHIKIDMHSSHINFLTFAGHKGFFAPQGIGALCINSDIKPLPLMFGGTGTNSISLEQPDELPEKYESGTLMTHNIIALRSAIKYVEKHFEMHNKKLELLTKYLYRKLNSLKEDKLKIYSLPQNKYGVISFEITNHDSVEVAQYLDEKFNIAVRSGLHCAPLTHKYFKTEKNGLVRVSLSFKNKKSEIDKLIFALNKFFEQNKQ